MQEKNNKRTIRAWAMFDWANSAYNLVITSTIFPAYYTIITTTKEYGDKVDFFGFIFVNTALSSYSLSVAYLIMAVLLPLLSGIADARGSKKQFMKVFTWIGSLACMGLFFFDLEHLELGVVLAAVAAMGYIGGVMFSNSYLPEIATPDKQDKVSAQGFSYGYVGSVILQILCFIVVLMPDLFGIPETEKALPSQISFLMVGVWWIGFAQIPFAKLPVGIPAAKKITSGTIKSGYQEIGKVWQYLKELKTLKRFLIAFFFYSVGVQTIMLVATLFGAKVLKMETSELIATILIIQLVAIAGAYLMASLAKTIGNIKVLMLTVSIWIAVCVVAYFIQTKEQFYGLAGLVGLIMGGIQSLSRSTYSKLLPEKTKDTASFFSFYDVTEKLAIVLGLATFAFIEERYNIRFSALGLTGFFVAGLISLFVVLKTKEQKSLD